MGKILTKATMDSEEGETGGKWTRTEGHLPANDYMCQSKGVMKDSSFWMNKRIKRKGKRGTTSQGGKLFEYAC